MKFVVFGPDKRVGALVENSIIDLNKSNPGIPSNLGALIAAGKPAITAARKAINSPKKAAVLKSKGMKIHAPWPGMRVAMAGGNYADHLAGMYANMRNEPLTPDSIPRAHEEARKDEQWGFWKVLHRFTGQTDNVPFPKRTQYLDFEGEVAIIIGRQGKDVPASRIKDYVWGVTLVNDWSIRDGRRTPRTQSYNVAKNFDGSCSMGPCIVVGELDCQNVDVQTIVNGELRQNFNSKDMIFSFGELLQYLSRDFTFVPGDVISGGTAKGTAADMTKNLPDGTRPTDLFLKKGDVVEVSSPQVGWLRNRLV